VAWAYVAVTITCTVYGQIILKWRVGHRGHLPAGLDGKLAYFADLLLDPWVLSVLAAGLVAALSWMAAVSRLPLSRAYPFVALSFVMVLLLSGVFFNETITWGKVAGVALITAGIAVGAGL
jgi:multidrug transporter EmrE-like cation transporter